MGTPKGFSKLTYATTLLLVTVMAGCSVGPEEGEGESTSGMETGYGYSSMANAYKIGVEDATVQDLIPHKVACPSQKNGNHQDQICIQICHVPPGNPDNSHDKVLPLSAIKAHLGHGDYLGRCDASAGELPVDEGSGGGSTDDGNIGDGNTGGTTDDSSSGDPSSGTTTTDDGSTGGETLPTDPSTEDPSSGDGPTGDSISGGSTDESVPDSGSSSGGDSSSGGETFPDEGTGGSVDDGAGDSAEGSMEVPNFCVPYFDIDQNCDGFNDSTGMPYL